MTIYNCRCEDILGELPKVDLCLNDPPYEDEAHVITRRTRATLENRQVYADIEFEKMNSDLRSFICDVKCNWLLNFCQAEAVYLYQKLLGKKYRRPMVWIKPDSCPQFTGDRPAMGYESIVCSWQTKGKSIWNGGGKRGVYTYNGTSGRFGGHPTEKPIKLIKELIIDFSLGGIILDMFAGSCTTGRAAKDMNIKCICIECEEKFAEIGAKRMCQEVMNFN